MINTCDITQYSAMKTLKNLLKRYRMKRNFKQMIYVQISLLFSRIKREGYVTKSAPARNKEREFGRTAMAYISEHFEENITSRTLADAMFMNVSYFCRVFKQTFGCCFSEYLMEYRLQAAAAKLRDSELSISNIAFGVGFNGSSYFTKSFKERFGETPCKYRKRNISNITP